MPTKPIDRLLFVQGDQCFFCNRSLDRANATVEHLLAASRGGSNGDDNCVACCKSINTLFGSMSLKEKFQVLLKQQGHFKCPNDRIPVLESTSSAPIPPTPPEPIAAVPVAVVAAKPAAPSKPKSQTAVDPVEPHMAAVLKDLKNRGNSRPAKLATLKSTIKAHLKTNDKVVVAVIEKLSAKGKVTIDGAKVSYKL